MLSEERLKEIANAVARGHIPQEMQYMFTDLLDEVRSLRSLVATLSAKCEPDECLGCDHPKADHIPACRVMRCVCGGYKSLQVTSLLSGI